jgi:hypothetical protein
LFGRSTNSIAECPPMMGGKGSQSSSVKKPSIHPSKVHQLLSIQSIPTHLCHSNASISNHFRKNHHPNLSGVHGPIPCRINDISPSRISPTWMLFTDQKRSNLNIFPPFIIPHQGVSGLLPQENRYTDRVSTLVRDSWLLPLALKKGAVSALVSFGANPNLTI